MKQVIRTNVFETNSSSVHALIMPKHYNIDEVERQGKALEMTVCGDEFGWGYEVHKDSWSILSYLWTGTQSTRLEELFPNVKFIPFMFDDTDYYIDHQSQCLPFDILDLSDDEIYNAVVNGRLVISNDNRDDPEINYDRNTEIAYIS